MEWIFAIAVCVTNTICLISCCIVGVKTGQALARGKEIKAPNPVRAIKEHQEERRQKEEEELVHTMFENIENYNGTGIGQKDL